MPICTSKLVAICLVKVINLHTMICKYHFISLNILLHQGYIYKPTIVTRLALYDRKKFSNPEHSLQLHFHEEFPFTLIKNSMWLQKIFHLAMLWVILLSQKWAKEGHYPLSSIMAQQGVLEPPCSKTKWVFSMPLSPPCPLYLQACLRGPSQWLISIPSLVTGPWHMPSKC